MKRVGANAIGLVLRNSTLAIVLLDLLFQIILIGKYLDNSVISPYAPTALDAADYAGRAAVWQTDGFSKAFGDAYRMPGYPLIILLMRLLIPSAPYLGVRLLQVLAVAASAGMIKKILDKYISAWLAITMSLVYVVLPIWHFVPILLAESLTSVIVVTLLLVVASVANVGMTKKLAVSISVLIALATYLKPNNLLLLVVISGFLIFTLKERLARSISGVILGVILLLSPWFIFANNAQPGFIGLTTNSGGNLYTGTGMILSYDQSVLAKSAVRWKVDPRSNPADVIAIPTGQPSAKENSTMTKKAIQIWRKRPLRELGYGLDKILIAFGIKSNSLIDHVFGLWSVLSLFAGVLLLKSQKVRAWGVTILITALLLAFQAVAFQADRRFVVPILFPLSAVCLGIALDSLFSAKLIKERILQMGRRGIRS